MLIFLKIHFYLHRLENRMMPISTPHKGQFWWDSNLHTCEFLLFHCATFMNWFRYRTSTLMCLNVFLDQRSFLCNKKIARLKLHRDIGL